MKKAGTRLKPGATRRLEVHTNAFRALTCRLSVENVGELMEMLMAEVMDEPIPPSACGEVNRLFAERREFSRIRGGFGRTTLPLATRKAVYERDGGVCRYCSKSLEWSDYHCDHIEPVKRGGTDDFSNLAASCRPCNLSKAAKPLKAWLQ